MLKPTYQLSRQTGTSITGTSFFKTSTCTTGSARIQQQNGLCSVAAVPLSYEMDSAQPPIVVSENLPYHPSNAVANKPRKALPAVDCEEELVSRPRRTASLSCAQLSGIVAAISMMAWLLYVNLFQPAWQQATDFLNSSYVAAHLIAAGAGNNLYSTHTSLEAPFNQVAHALLPLLSPGSYVVWQYSPLNAWLFQPFVAMAPGVALMAFQSLTLAALALCCFLIGKARKMKPAHLFWAAFLLFPVFQTLKMGQQGILFGLLPLCFAYMLLRKRRHILAGLMLSTTFLNPKFAIAAGLIAVALFIARQRKVLVSFMAGMAVMLAISCLTCPQATLAWIQSIPAAENFFFDPHLQTRTSLVASLPPLALMSAPAEWRTLAKLIVYGICGSSALIAACLVGRNCLKVPRTRGEAENRIAAPFIVAMYLMPLVEPHFLYYDLCALLLANFLILGWHGESREKLLNTALRATIAVDVYFLLVALNPPEAVQPYALVGFLVYCAFAILKGLIGSKCNTSEQIDFSPRRPALLSTGQ